MLFLSASVMGGLILAFGAMPALVDSPTFTITRAISWEIMNLYAIRMAGVFMMSTATLALRTGFIARPIALLGFLWPSCCCSRTAPCRRRWSSFRSGCC